MIYIQPTLSEIFLKAYEVNKPFNLELSKQSDLEK